MCVRLSPVKRCMFAIGLISMIGCSSLPTRSENHRELAACSNTETRSIAIDTTHHPVLDRIEYAVEWPKRLIGGGDTDEDQLSPETIEKLQQYLVDNGLDEVGVVFNEYSPKAQWQRLKANKRIAAGWKYSVGTATFVAGTIFPARVFDRNVYNPFTNTLEIHSDRLFEIITQSVLAHRAEQKRWRGSYAALVQLPPVAMVARTGAGYEAVEYAQQQGDWELEQSGYRELYPQTAMVGTMAASPFMPFYAMPVIGIGGQFVGTQIANRKIEYRKKERERSQSEGHSLVASELQR